ncbi:MAG: hypothetical protein NVSMB46_00860 [Candidatus Saccharimonadales bacterium]
MNNLNRYTKIIKNKKLTVIIGFVLVLCTLTTYFILNRAIYRHKNNVCSEGVIKEASKELYSNNTLNLSHIVKNIENLGGYKNDPNCLYITTNYYIKILDAQNSQSSLSSLEKVYNSKVGFSRLFGARIKSIDKIKFEVNYVIRSTTETQKNTTYIQRPRK